MRVCERERDLKRKKKAGSQSSALQTKTQYAIMRSPFQDALAAGGHLGAEVVAGVAVAVLLSPLPPVERVHAGNVGALFKGRK